MHKTVGKADRAVRVVLGAGAVAGSGVLGFSTAWGIVLLAAGAVMVVTAVSGYCPLYSLLGIETTATEPQSGSRDETDASPLSRAA